MAYSLKPLGRPSAQSLAARVGLIGAPLLAVAIWLGPLLGYSLSAENPQLNAMAAVTVLMALWWVTEAIPLAATALLPLALFGPLKILPAGALAASYGNRMIFLFLGGFLVALAIEESGLHRRVALNLVAVMGDRPRRIVFGFMSASYLLSMWLSNTATTLMLLPIAASVLSGAGGTAGVASRVAGGDMPQATDGHRRLATCLMLSIAYAASIGGISTLIGTPPNVAFRAFYEREVPGGSVDFVEWMVMAVPLTATLLVAAWALLCLAVFRVENRPMFGGQNSIASQRAALGPMQPAERRTGGVFIALAALWILREPAAGWGWAPMLGIGRATIDGRQVHWVDDSTVAMAMALVCFILPSGRTDRSRLLTWNTARRVPWEILLLFGGGLALAAGMSETGLDAFLGTQLQRALGPLSPGVQMAAVTGSMTLLTELTSNLASVLMILPILHSAAESLGVDPRSLMIPATIAASCAFMLPVATPPNAIVYGSGHVRIRDMIRAGVWMNLVSIVVIVLYLGLVLPR